MTRSQNPITQLRRRVTRGEQLTPAEQAQLTAYYGRWTRRKQGVHLKGDREQRWRTMAAAEGVTLSSWIQKHVESDLIGPGEALRELREENQRLRDELVGARGASGHLAVENSKLQARLEGLEASLMEAMEQALRLQGAMR